MTASRRTAEATARHTMLPGAGAGRASEGMVLSTPLTGVQQAVGVMVFFCPRQPSVPLETALACLNVAGTVLGCHLQTASLQERLKAHDTASAAAALSASYNPDQIVGHSPRMKAILHEIQQAATSRSTILLRGESGTGKELVARALHKAERPAPAAVRQAQLRRAAGNAAGKANCSGTKKAPSPGRSRRGAAVSSWRTAAPCSSTKSAT